MKLMKYERKSGECDAILKVSAAPKGRVRYKMIAKNAESGKKFGCRGGKTSCLLVYFGR